jgi:hypothetical protein
LNELSEENKNYIAIKKFDIFVIYYALKLSLIEPEFIVYTYGDVSVNWSPGEYSFT